MRKKMPTGGLSSAEIQGALSEARKNGADWKKGRLWGMVYYAGDDVLRIAMDAYAMFFSENMVVPEAFPGLARLETEVIDMAAQLLGGGEAARGVMTSGGTESNFLAIKAAREWAREQGSIKGAPEIVAARSAHPTFNKAAHFLGLTVKRVPLGPDYRADVPAMERALTPNTIMLVGSAPGYPHGKIDPIVELGKLAQTRNLWLHVDACVGGFLAPFVKKLGNPLPEFDLTVPGVCSLSADLHKHGYTGKGASMVLFRDESRFQYSAHDFDDWPRGRYLTRTFTGTRSGGPVACAWAVLNFLGEEGYLRLARDTLRAQDLLIEGINSIHGLEICGEPELGIITFGSHQLDMFAVADGLDDLGWVTNRCTEPPGIHLLLTPNHLSFVSEYLSDLATAVADVREGKRTGKTTKTTY
ncbi:MAG: aspartate aminotransferase family protein [Bryobacterales bacterium]|nr:aspartate aminotransferase family protein [Bryobacterales bacterium]